MKLDYDLIREILLTLESLDGTEIITHNFPIRWNSKDLIHTISRMCNWDLKKISYRVNGILIPESSVMLFNLNDATPMS